MWLAGVAMRMTLLVVPPVIPLVHEQLHMSETQIGLLIGLPLAMFAIAAVPGSLLIARIGAKPALILGMFIAALAGGARGAAIDVWTLYAASIVTGFGIAIMQPAMPTLVRNWLPGRVGLGTVAYSNGMVVGATLPPILTLPLILPWVGGSWRLDFVVWALPAVIMVVAFSLLSPKEQPAADFKIQWRHRHARQIVVAGLEKSADLAARSYLRQQQQSVLRRQCVSRRLSRHQGRNRRPWPRARVAERGTNPGAGFFDRHGRSHAAGKPGRSCCSARSCSWVSSD